MEKVSSLFVLGGACGLVLLISAFRRRAQILLNLTARVLLGAFCIYWANHFFAEQGIALSVGLNPISLLTSGILGFSGVAVLYAISACKFL